MKYFLFGLLALASTSFSGAAQDLSAEKIAWYAFEWEGSPASPKEVMILHSTIDTLRLDCKWQFDTGSGASFFYEKTYRSIQDAYPYLKEKYPRLDSINADWWKTSSPAVKVGGSALPNKDYLLYMDYGDYIDPQVWKNEPTATTTIGTLGLDQFSHGVLIIDLSKDRIGYASNISTTFYSKAKHTVSFRFFKNRIILPISIGKKKLEFFYDSGASIFPLKTTASLQAALPAVQFTDTLRNITTWGKSYDIPGGRLQQQPKLGSLPLEPSRIYVHPDPEGFHSKIFREAGVTGLIGNQPFDKKILVIDFVRKRFTVLEK